MTAISDAATTVSADATLARLFPRLEESSRLTVSCRRADYSASALARAVEDCNAHLLNLNVTADAGGRGGDMFSDYVTVELRISHRNASAAARSLERYGFRVLDVEEDRQGFVDDDSVRERVNQLIHYLDV